MSETVTPGGGQTPPPPPTVIVQQQTRRGCGFWMGWILAVVFFWMAVLCFIALISLSIGGIGEIAATKTLLRGALTEKTVEGSGTDKVLLLPVRGLISEHDSETFWTPGENTVQYVRNRLKAAREDSAVKAVLLMVDSPGGGITASDIINEEIKRFKKDTGRKVVVCMGDVAASGGYYISSAADWIVAHPTTITGSIGVIMINFDATLLLEKIGVQNNPIKSGPYKDMGSWMRTMTPEERQMLQAMIDEMLGRFVQVICEGRKLPKDKVQPLADGRVLTATQAKAAKLIDAIGYYEDALKKIRELANLPEKVKVVRYDKTFSLASLLGVEVESWRRGHGLQAALRDLALPQGPRLMYLWTGR